MVADEATVCRQRSERVLTMGLYAQFETALGRLATASSRAEAEARLPEVWKTVVRDDETVARELAETRSIDGIHALGESTFMDELFHYVRKIGAWPLLTTLDPGKRKRPLYPFVLFVLFMIMRSVSAAGSMLATRDKLLADEKMMELLGFNALQVRQGCNERGLTRRTQPIEVRGPFSFETAADNLVKLGPEALERLFNGMIRCLAAHRAFGKKLDVVLDATDVEATPKFKTDDGQPVPHVKREKRPDVRNNRHAQKVEVTVFGWKAWVVWDLASKIPLAIRFDGINEPENLHAFSVLDQARRNVEGYAKIRSVSLDRGFLDGPLLHQIHDKVTRRIYIPAKSNLKVTADARALAKYAIEEQSAGRKTPGCTIRKRETKCLVGSGRNAREANQSTVLVGIDDLPCEWWRPEGQTSDENRKDFKSPRIRASVIALWNSRRPKPDEEWVLLTTDPSRDPFAAFDAYDRRSEIENGCFREAKEKWFLESSPKRSEAGMRVQAYFVFLSMALVTAFRARRTRDEEKTVRTGRPVGILRFRRMMEAANRDRVLIHIGDHYGIFRNAEIMTILGVDVRRHTQGTGETREHRLTKYRVAAPP